MFSPFYNGDYSYDQPIDFESLFDLLHQHQFYYKENTRPRVIKKLETEDEFQIQIYKPYGNYNNYEVNVVKSNPLLSMSLSAPSKTISKLFCHSMSTILILIISMAMVQATKRIGIEHTQENPLCSSECSRYPQLLVRLQ